jgi:NAD(P)H dehydrogenase (quinone)
MADHANIASEVPAREVRFTTVSDDEWRVKRIASGMPADYAEMLLGVFQAARAGELVATDPMLQTLLGARNSGSEIC